MEMPNKIKKLKRFEETVLEEFLSALTLAERNEGNADIEIGTVFAKEISSKALRLAKEAVGEDEDEGKNRIELGVCQGCQEVEAMCDCPGVLAIRYANNVRQEIREKLDEIFGEEGRDE